MSEIYYDFILLFKNEDHAVRFFIEAEDAMKVAQHELIRLVNLVCGVDIDSRGYEFDLNHAKRFRNEIQISTYTGRSSEFPLDIVKPLHAAGCGLLRISVLYEDMESREHRWFVDGKKSTRKRYEQLFKKFKVEDHTDQLQRLLENRKFKQAAAIVDDCDLSRILPDEEFIHHLISEGGKHDELAIKLLRAGVLDKPNPASRTPWLNFMAQSGSPEVLAACLEHGLDPYESGGPDGFTALHAVLYSDGKRAADKVRILISTCKDNLTPVSEQGSPLWLGYENRSIVGCQLMSEAGAKTLPPPGFYDDTDQWETVVQAASHGDIEKLKSNYSEEMFDAVVFHGLHCQSYDVIEWVNQQKPIDWTATYHGPARLGHDSLDEFYTALPLYEQPFPFFNKGSSFDARIVELVIDSVPSSDEIYSRLLVYISGIKYFPQGVALLKKLMRLGADINAKIAVGADPTEITAIYRALFYECLENVEVLLAEGADTSSRAFLEGVTFEDVIRASEIPFRQQVRKVWKKYH